MKTYQAGSQFCCPHCEKICDGVVDDYVIPGRTGEASRASEQCGWCDEWFEVYLDRDGTLVVEEVEKEEDDEP